VGVGEILLFVAFFSARPAGPSQTVPSPPREASICEILKDPKTFDRKTVQFRGLVSAEFEDFTVSCDRSKDSPVWLMFGGDVDCPTPSTWNDVGRLKGKNVEFDGVAYTLVKDKSFRTFHKALVTRKNKQSVYRVTATLEGTFFAGDTDDTMPGYGHLGCCHLFIIHRISEVHIDLKPRV
jgi:hypothetical protein